MSDWKRCGLTKQRELSPEGTTVPHRTLHGFRPSVCLSSPSSNIQRAWLAPDSLKLKWILMADAEKMGKNLGAFEN